MILIQLKKKLRKKQYLKLTSLSMNRKTMTMMMMMTRVKKLKKPKVVMTKRMEKRLKKKMTLDLQNLPNLKRLVKSQKKNSE